MPGLAEGDPFLTLAPAARAGLVILSLTLAALALIATRRAALGRPVWARVTLAALALWFWVWLTPQLYYLYYVAILPVPPRIVIAAPPDPRALLELLSFTARPYSGDWARGALGWALIAATLGARR